MTGNRIKPMRLPSRLLPPRHRESLDHAAVLFLTILVVGFGYLLYSASTFARCMIAMACCAVWCHGAAVTKREKRRYEALARSRLGVSICEFARSFDVRQTDTWIMRATYQELQQWLQPYVTAFPVCASDRLSADFHLEADDVDDLLQDIAARSGRSLEKTEDNPWYGSVHTVKDLVAFINAQAATSRRQASAVPQ